MMLLREGRQVPKLQRILNVTHNKKSLIKFLGDYCKENISTLKDTQSVFIAGASTDPEHTFCIKQNSVEDVPVLYHYQTE